ncbi:MAG: hypothetical protein IPN17_38320 [Deltaproteobacteria bacterium]|nr:hypothetical protein [Deltaproteobacteria bacterium]
MLVQRGHDGEDLPPEVTHRRLVERTDALRLDAVDPATGSLRPVWSGRGQLAFLATALRDDEVLVYLLQDSGSSLLRLDARTGDVALLHPDLSLARDFSYDAARDEVVFARALSPTVYEVASLRAHDPSPAAITPRWRSSSDHLMPRVLRDGAIGLSLPGDHGLGWLPRGASVQSTPAVFAPRGDGSDALLSESDDGRWIALRHTTDRDESVVVAQRRGGARARDRVDRPGDRVRGLRGRCAVRAALLGVAIALAGVEASAQCSGGSACPPCRSCRVAAASGANPSVTEMSTLFDRIAAGPVAYGSLGWDFAGRNTVGAGGGWCGGSGRRDTVTVTFPCVLLKAIYLTESSWRQFCTTNETVISFDCGYGIAQVTSGHAPRGDQRLRRQPRGLLGGVQRERRGGDPHGQMARLALRRGQRPGRGRGLVLRHLGLQRLRRAQQPQQPDVRGRPEGVSHPRPRQRPGARQLPLPGARLGLRALPPLRRPLHRRRARVPGEGGDLRELRQAHRQHQPPRGIAPRNLPHRRTDGRGRRTDGRPGAQGQRRSTRQRGATQRSGPDNGIPLDNGIAPDTGALDVPVMATDRPGDIGVDAVAVDVGVSADAGGDSLREADEGCGCGVAGSGRGGGRWIAALAALATASSWRRGRRPGPRSAARRSRG